MNLSVCVRARACACVRARLSVLLPLCLYAYPAINFSMPQPIFIKHGIYIMTHEAISMSYSISPFDH
jgi:hypothetical protein